LATADIKGHPLNVPLCYVLDGEELYSPIDEKPKTSSPLLLKRILNIRQNPHVSVVVDRYDDDWERLAYVIITGKARVLTRGKRHQKSGSREHGISPSALAGHPFESSREQSDRRYSALLLLVDTSRTPSFGSPLTVEHD
jgi:hypothetical protein